MYVNNIKKIDMSGKSVSWLGSSFLICKVIIAGSSTYVTYMKFSNHIVSALNSWAIVTVCSNHVWLA